MALALKESCVAETNLPVSNFSKKPFMISPPIAMGKALGVLYPAAQNWRRLKRKRKFYFFLSLQVFPPTPNGHRSSQLSLMDSIPNKAPSYDEDMDSIAEWGAIERGKFGEA